MTTTISANQALWEKGDFTRIAAAMRGSGEALVRSIGVSPGMDVLDLGCGDGTTALPSAKLGAQVLGVDISRPLLEAARKRASEAGLANIRFQHGDACKLELPDDRFDLVVSIFGAMFAPRPFDVAREMVRVTRPGGRIVMGNWIPGDPTFVAQLLKTSAAYTPPPPEGFVSPVTWGQEANVKQRFGEAGIPADAIRCDRDVYRFEYDGTPEQYIEEFRRYYGPTMNAFEAAEKNGKAQALREELDALARRANTSTDPKRTVIPAAFLRVTVQVG